MPGIDRPAIAAYGRRCAANPSCSMSAPRSAPTPSIWSTRRHGRAMARALFDLERPTVGLLNIGVEEVKGLDEIREAGRFCARTNLDHLEYAGFVEGDDIGKGTADVVVTEGFSRQYRAEDGRGTARQIAAYLRGAMTRVASARGSAIWRATAFQALREKIDPRHVQRRRVSRPQRHRHQEPRRHRCRRLRLGDRHRLRAWSATSCLRRSINSTNTRSATAAVVQRRPRRSCL